MITSITTNNGVIHCTSANGDTAYFTILVPMHRLVEYLSNMAEMYGKAGTEERLASRVFAYEHHCDHQVIGEFSLNL